MNEHIIKASCAFLLVALATSSVAFAATPNNTTRRIDASNYDVVEAGRAHAVRPAFILDVNLVYATDEVAEGKGTIGVGTGVGAVAGAAAGSTASDKNKAATTVGGAVIGGMIGNIFDLKKKAAATKPATAQNLVVQFADDGAVMTVVQGVEPTLMKGTPVWVEMGSKLRVFPRDVSVLVDGAATVRRATPGAADDPEVAAARERVATLRAQAEEARAAAAAKEAKEKALAALAAQEEAARAELAAVRSATP